VPEDRHPADRQHRLWQILVRFTNPRAQSAAQNDCFHFATPTTFTLYHHGWYFEVPVRIDSGGQEPLMRRIAVAGPWITELEVRLVSEAAQTAWYEKANVFHERFEKAFAKHLGVRFAVALPSCTSAIHLALAAHGVGPGDEVIVPDATWIASSAPVSYLGATPIFADVDATTWCLDPNSVASCLSARTRAIIGVDLYGGMVDYDRLRALTAGKGILLLEDAAEAIGSTWRGRPAGALGDVGVFSFHGSKTLTTGEGGLLATDNEELYKRVLVLRDHGRKPGDRMFKNDEIAFKYKMSSMQAALGCAQLERLPELIKRKRDIFAWYREEFQAETRLTLNAEPEGTFNNFWMVTAVLDRALKISKEDLMSHLDNLGIDSRPFFHPLSSLPAYARASDAPRARAQNRVSYDISVRALNLPSALCLTREDVARVGEAVRQRMQGAHG
jgi:perosamine synthetase